MKLDKWFLIICPTCNGCGHTRDDEDGYCFTCFGETEIQVKTEKYLEHLKKQRKKKKEKR